MMVGHILEKYLNNTDFVRSHCAKITDRSRTSHTHSTFTLPVFPAGSSKPEKTAKQA